jgi:hypothetical protein
MHRENVRAMSHFALTKTCPSTGSFAAPCRVVGYRVGSVDPLAMPASVDEVRRAGRRIVVLGSMGLSMTQIARRAGVSP